MHSPTKTLDRIYIQRTLTYMLLNFFFLFNLISMLEIVFLTHSPITYHKTSESMYTSKSNPFCLLSPIPCLLKRLKLYFSLGIPFFIPCYLFIPCYSTQLLILNNHYYILHNIPRHVYCKGF